MATIVEIMGLPGSGKTTATAILLRALREQGVSVLGRRESVLSCLRRRPDRWIKGFLKHLPVWLWEPLLGSQTAFLEFVGFAARHPKLFKILADWTVRSGWDEQKRHGILWAFALLFAEAELIRRHAPVDAVVLFDEGFAHRGFSLFGYLPPDRVPAGACSDYVDAIPLPSAAVWIDAGIESCARRLGMRPAFPLLARGATSDDPRIQLHQGQAVSERIAAALEQKGVPTWRVDNRDGRQAEATKQMLQGIVPRIIGL